MQQRAVQCKPDRKEFNFSFTEELNQSILSTRSDVDSYAGSYFISQESAGSIISMKLEVDSENIDADIENFYKGICLCKQSIMLSRCSHVHITLR